VNCAFTGAGVEVDEHDLLPSSQWDKPVYNRQR